MAEKGKRKNRGMGARRNKLLRGIAKGMTISEAGQYARYSSPASAHRAFTSLRPEIIESAMRQGMNVDTLVKFLIDKTQAKETKFITDGGIIKAIREVEAHGVQLDAADKFLRIFDGYARRDDERVDHSAATPVLHIHLGLSDSGRARDLVENARKRIGLGDLGRSDLDGKLDQNEG